MKSLELPCGYTLIPFIYKGKKNNNISTKHLKIAEEAIEKMQIDRQNVRLSSNYNVSNLHLDKMHIYSILYDFSVNLPVLASGVQVVGKTSARVFSRYFVFPEYKTKYNLNGITKKIDNFDVLKNDIEFTKKEYPFIFWSRDKGLSFFRKIKKSREDIFSQWSIYPTKVELLYKENYQGVFYYNSGDELTENILENDLKFKETKK